jgi:hypothetical protein
LAFILPLLIPYSSEDIFLRAGKSSTTKTVAINVRLHCTRCRLQLVGREFARFETKLCLVFFLGKKGVSASVPLRLFQKEETF